MLVDDQAVVEPFEVRNWPLVPGLPALSKSLRMVAKVDVLLVLEAFVANRLVAVAFVIVALLVMVRLSKNDVEDANTPDLNQSVGVEVEYTTWP